MIHFLVFNITIISDSGQMYVLHGVFAGLSHTSLAAQPLHKKEGADPPD